MKAARLHAYGRPLVLDEVPTPRPGPGQVVVKVEGAGFVIGLGGLGQYGLEILRLSSACPVIAVDVDETKRSIAKELGAKHVLDGKDPSLVTKVMDLTAGRGVTAAFDFVGSDATLALAVATTKTLGKVTQVGLAGGTDRLKVLENSRFEVQFEVTLWGTIRELREVLALAESGSLKLIQTEYAPLENINDVYSRLKRGQVPGRAVITP